MPDETRYDPQVETLQKYLRAAAKEDDGLPLIAADGIFGPETTAAVKALQLREGLAVTGVVDLVTWTAAKEAYLRSLRERADGLSVSPFGSGGELTPGSASPAVHFLRGALAAICAKYPNVGTAEPAEYGEAERAAVENVQRAAGTRRRDGTVDRETWDAVARLYGICR